jgi:uncharacterized glyoxalase superfamily protein PhnB
MKHIIKHAIPVLPAADTTESLNWWRDICGFEETFRDATPPAYVGIKRGDAWLHIAGMDDKGLARTVGNQTMVRVVVTGIESLYEEFQKRGGKVHPNGPLQTKPWGTKEFVAIDPNGVCVTFQE